MFTDIAPCLLRSGAFTFETDNHEKFQLLFVQRGQLHLRTPHQQLIARSGMVLLMPRGTSFTLSAREPGYEGLSLWSADTDNLSRAFTGLPSIPCFAAAPKIKQLAHDIRVEMQLIAPRSEEVIQAQCRLMLAYVLRQYEVLGVKRDSSLSNREIVSVLRRRIHAGLYSATSVEELSSGIPLCQRHLERLFKAETGLSIKQYQLWSKTEEAKQLLLDPSYKVRSIAMELGFLSPKHFSVQFRKLTGTTPIAYRRENLR